MEKTTIIAIVASVLVVALFAGVGLINAESTSEEVSTGATGCGSCGGNCGAQGCGLSGCGMAKTGSCGCAK